MGSVNVTPPKALAEEWDQKNAQFKAKATVREQLEAAVAHAELTPEEQAEEVASERAETNLIQRVLEEDYRTIDVRQSRRMPPMIRKELQQAGYMESCRRCLEVEKEMARCLQNKLYTSFKCEREKNQYLRCIESHEDSKTLLNDLRWKYNVGVFHGEIVARRRLMKHLWSEYWPDQPLPYAWADDP